MGYIKDILNTIKPTKNDEARFYLIQQIIKSESIKTTFRFTDVSSGLASLIKKNYGGHYIKTRKIFLLNDNHIDEIWEIQCNLSNLEKIVIEIKKREG